MADPEAIKKAFERNVRAVELRPSRAQSTAVTKIRVRDGTTCEVEHGDWRFTADVGPDAGGNDAGPGPGILERAALGSCLAIGYATWAAKMDVPLDRIEVDVETEFDARGSLGITDQAPGFRRICYRVRIESSAPKEEIRKVVDEADAHSPVRDDFRRAIPMERDLHITTTA